MQILIQFLYLFHTFIIGYFLLFIHLFYFQLNQSCMMNNESLFDIIQDKRMQTRLFKQKLKELTQQNKINFQGMKNLQHPDWYKKYVIERDLTKGDYIITEGEQAKSFFVLLRGWCKVKINRFKNRNINKILEGDCFGERSIRKKKRSASVIAGCDECWVLEILYAGLGDLQLFSLSDDDIWDNNTDKEDDMHQERHNKDASTNVMGWRERHQRLSALEIIEIEEMIKTIPELHPFNAVQIRKLIQNMYKVKIKQQRYLTLTNHKADALYIVQKGKFNIKNRNNQYINKECNLKLVGFDSLRYDRFPKYSIQATKILCQAFKIDKTDFCKAMDALIASETLKIVEFLKEIVLFKRLSEKQFIELAKYNCQTNVYLDDEIILNRTDTINKLYIIKHGIVVRSDTKIGGNHDELDRTMYFGEKCLQTEKISLSSFCFKSNGATEIVEINRESLISLIEQKVIEFHRSHHKKVTSIRTSDGRPSKMQSFDNHNDLSWLYNLESLSGVKTGQHIEHSADGYTRICQVYNPQNTARNKNMPFIGCLKRINKVVGNIKYCSREIQALQRIQSPFIAKLYSVIYGEFDVSMIMDICLGGTMKRLRYHQSTSHLFQDIENIKFYAANLAIALDHIHSNGIIYRNLSLQNLRIANNGYLKLYNFQQSIFLPAESRLSLCAGGNINRTAPEIIIDGIISYSVDWWMYAIILTELLIGYNPFFDIDKASKYDINSKIKKQIHFCVKELENSSNCLDDPSIINMIQSCLNYNSTKRMDIDSLKDHSFFEDINWRDIELQTFKVPFIPVINTSDDLSNWGNILNKQDSSIFEITQNLRPKNSHHWSEKHLYLHVE